MRFILAAFLLSFTLSGEELELNTSEVCNAVITKRLQSNQDAYKQAIDKINQCKKNNTSLFLVTHNESILNKFDRVLHLENGTIS